MSRLFNPGIAVYNQEMPAFAGMTFLGFLMPYYLYMMSNGKYGTIYTGVTNNLVSRGKDHRDKTKEGFTKRYNLVKLVYFETYDDVRDAIHREKCVKAWKREWKINLIEKENPEWLDLYPEILK